MKKVHIPGSVIFGALIVAACLFGLLTNISEGIDLRMLAVLIVAVAFIVIFCRKNIHTVEETPLQGGRKPSKSKFVASKEKDDDHQRKLLNLYMYQKEEYRKNARNGIVFGTVGLIILYLMWGSDRLKLPVFIVLSLFCIYYAGRCIWHYFINSDKPRAREIAAKLNMTTLQDQIDYTEKVIRENDEKKKLSGLPEDTIAFMDKDKYLENKE